MWIEHTKDIAESVALLCGGFFFGYKWYTGYLRVNLSLSVQCKRQSRSDRASDYLVVCVKIQKGPNGSVTLHDAAARVTYGDTSQLLSFPGIARSEHQSKDFGGVARHVIDWPRISSASPLLKLVPDEETELSMFCKVPSDATCTVEVAILGRKTQGHPFGQWKASCTSLPRVAV